MPIVIFTGAGAGKADGLPLQTEVFTEFFGGTPINTARDQLRSRVSEFFETVFGIDATRAAAGELPTFEEALGLLDLALAREDNFLCLQTPGTGNRDLRAIRRDLILALAATVGRESDDDTTVHAALIGGLRDASLLTNTVFVTTNYDTLLDDALDAEAVVVEDRGTGTLVDYGFRELSHRTPSEHSDPRQFALLKIHGSLNWLYCPTCDRLDVTYGSDGVVRLVDEPDGALCLQCEALRTPVIVPPSYYKNMSNVYLSVVWKTAFHALKQADHIVFCGYSFPDADIHIKYLVKRAQLNRPSPLRPAKISLVNHHPGKDPGVSASEYNRFARFFGRTLVSDRSKSFAEFAADPTCVLA
jgi:NAD-dependent SIR2 family protein deacetylase